MRRSFRKLEAVLAVFCLAGCGKTYVETDVTVAVVQPETSRVEVTTARETEEETQPETEPEPEERVEVCFELTETAFTAPVERGTQVGEAVCYVNGKELLRTPLVSGESVPGAAAPERGGWLWRNVFKN